jgi:LmbE family N-acetylglucosaminyl deacetylase
MRTERILLVAAHPDDEVIGAGGQLAEWRKGLTILHVTDGAPRNLADAREAGFETRAEYAQARRREMLAAVALAGVDESQCHELGIVDQEASIAMADIAARLREWIARMRPATILTHPYEGGHPDHDACAFAVHRACALAGAPEEMLWEFTSYHAGPQGTVTGEFLPGGEQPPVRFELGEDARRRKRRMLDCFATQKAILEWFTICPEMFRQAPRYDFTAPPHDGELHYERFDWGMRGARWRELAAAVAATARSEASHGAHRS